MQEVKKKVENKKEKEIEKRKLKKTRTLDNVGNQKNVGNLKKQEIWKMQKIRKRRKSEKEILIKSTDQRINKNLKSRSTRSWLGPLVLLYELFIEFLLCTITSVTFMIVRAI